MVFVEPLKVRLPFFIRKRGQVLSFFFERISGTVDAHLGIQRRGRRNVWHHFRELFNHAFFEIIRHCGHLLKHGGCSFLDRVEKRRRYDFLNLRVSKVVIKLLDKILGCCILHQSSKFIDHILGCVLVLMELFGGVGLELVKSLFWLFGKFVFKITNKIELIGRRTCKSTTKFGESIYLDAPIVYGHVARSLKETGRFRVFVELECNVVLPEANSSTNQRLPFVIGYPRWIARAVFCKLGQQCIKLSCHCSSIDFFSIRRQWHFFQLICQRGIVA
mmetsp:Transcript_16727/g.24996  ORF Transcript_16727/g.24996 Transcript_16727/m.24996 type:complete len:275 (-) Transcript_16727:91-915(-)